MVKSKNKQVEAVAKKVRKTIKKDSPKDSTAPPSRKVSSYNAALIRVLGFIE